MNKQKIRNPLDDEECWSLVRDGWDYLTNEKKYNLEITCVRKLIKNLKEKQIDYKKKK